MNDITQREIKTGSDPRSLPNYAVLRDELGKLKHPARPDVNWNQVEALSLSLFEINGVELQTGAWYTLARCHKARIIGLNEGLTIINALMSHQWKLLWPHPVHARVEILSGLFQRLQKNFRTFSLNHDDLPSLLQTEKLLDGLRNILACHKLKYACQIEPLMQQVRSALTRLEKAPPQNSVSTDVALPSQAFTSTPIEGAIPLVSRLVYVIRPEPEVSVDVVHKKIPLPKRWPVFIAGVCPALIVGAVALWGWHYAHRIDEASQALTGSVTALPQLLNAEQIRTLRLAARLKPDAADWLKQADSRLNTLAALPADWAFQYGNSLLNQAQTLWPDRSEVAEIRKQWQQRLAANVLPSNSLTGWHEGMQQLQSLADKLDTLDGQRGKYITVSELKSQVYGVMTSLRQTAPVEEQFRQLILLPESSPQRQQLIRQVEQHLRAQIYLLNQEKYRKQVRGIWHSESNEAPVYY